jgi:hypothetical protein
MREGDKSGMAKKLRARAEAAPKLQLRGFRAGAQDLIVRLGSKCRYGLSNSLQTFGIMWFNASDHRR